MIELIQNTMKLFAFWIFCFFLQANLGLSHSFKGLTLAQQNDIIQAYWGSFTKFKTKMCDASDKETFDKLYKEYVGVGYYIPTYNNKIVKEVLKESIPLLNLKIDWIESQIANLDKLKNLPDLNEDVQKLQAIIDANARLRFQIDQGLATEKSSEGEGKKQVEEFKKVFQSFLEKIFYLKNFKFPVDHLLNRLTYDRLAEQPVPQTTNGLVPELVIKKLNLYLKRKFLEDGAMDPDLTRTDMFVRTTLDTFFLELEKTTIFFSPELIRDWKWLSKSLNGIQGRGIAQQKLRQKEWQGRMIAMRDFYNDLIKKDLAFDSKYMEDIVTSSDNLKKFVEGKLAQTYKFWLDQREELKILFILETILMHEVGSVDPIGDQRKEVIRVVLNRVQDKAYHFLKATDPWESLLGLSLKEKPHWWLNVMFRKGEFSFMHFFMKSSYKVFCPDNLDSNINKLREENLKLALDVLKVYDPTGADINIFNYFSRVSMLGRIDMTSVWSPRFELVGESPGSRADSHEEVALISEWKKGNWTYLYSFTENTVVYRVFDMNGKIWTALWNKDAPSQFYHYRDRDYFKYFRRIN